VGNRFRCEFGDAPPGLHSLITGKRIILSEMMLEVKLEAERKPNEVSGALIVPMFKGEEKAEPAVELEGNLEAVVGRVSGHEFKAELEEVYSIPIGVALDRLILAGLGEKKEFDLDCLRRAYGKAALKADELELESVNAVIPKIDKPVHEVVQAIAEGAILALYRFERYKSEKKERKLRELKIFTKINEETKKAIETATKICEGVKVARDIANTPSSDCTPDKFAEMAMAAVKNLGIRYRVYGMKELQEMGMGGIVNVGRGSRHEPKLIELEYDGGGDLYVVAGKAVTFDSGGISIKPHEKLHEMKFDKSGGAAVVGILVAAALLKLPIRLIGLIPVVENMPSGSAYKPGDIIRFRNGKTAEIISTDAEGRLILADALAYGAEKKPRALIDLATLTGACVIALGNHASGLFSNNDELAEKLIKSGEEARERVWRLPLWKPYYNQLKSEVADMKNTGGSAGGAITAAAFLSNFVGDNAWAHLDIAGTAWTQEQSEQKSYIPKGATGVGVRLIVNFLMKESKKKN